MALYPWAPNKANFRRSWPETESRAEKQTQSKPIGTGGAVRPVALYSFVQNKPNSPRFWPANADWAKKQSQSRRARQKSRDTPATGVFASVLRMESEDSDFWRGHQSKPICRAGVASPDGRGHRILPGTGRAAKIGPETRNAREHGQMATAVRAVSSLELQ